MSMLEIKEQIRSLASLVHTLAGSIDVGAERVEAFELYEVLRRLQRKDSAGEMLAATNPLLCSDDGSYKSISSLKEAINAARAEGISMAINKLEASNFGEENDLKILRRLLASVQPN